MAVSFTIRVDADNSGLTLLQLAAAVKKSLDDIGKLVADAARGAAPRATGALAGSITYLTDSETVSIGSPLDYACYVELGTGPHYTEPPGWLQHTAPRGHHDTDPWWYMGDDGEWHMGWFVPARPFLGPAVMNNVGAMEDIVRRNLQNA